MCNFLSISTKQLHKELKGKLVKDRAWYGDGFRSYIIFAQSIDLIQSAKRSRWCLGY
jgi:hypothetical protein